MKQNGRRSGYAVCVNNEDYPASLELRKIYETVADVEAGKHGLVRVVDESGEDYLYPAEYFMSIDLPRPLKRALSLTAS